MNGQGKVPAECPTESVLLSLQAFIGVVAGAVATRVVESRRMPAGIVCYSAMLLGRRYVAVVSPCDGR